ncbi:MAG: acyl-ACP--UDP-N-acetylglucosamine O-acyltransferase [Endomicrobiales bacterium]|nr:acyl-ACP--UDP-N-acetylglucosamine O-acyltransferase [Endomicrobiales bacterium]
MIHETAIISKNAHIAKDVVIGAYSIIGDGVTIHSGVKVDSHTVIEHAEIGKNCRIFSHAAVGTAPQDLKYKNEDSKLVIGDNCIVREFTTLNRGTTATGKTVIGSDCMFMAYSHVAHDCRIGDNVIMANVATLGGHVEIGDYAFVGGLAAVHQFVRIGRLAMIGGGSCVTLDILPYTQVQGDRARLLGLNLVGMKRRKLSAEAMEDIKTVYRTLFLTGIPMEEALDQLEAMNPKKEVREMLDFIHASKRGIARPRKKEEEIEEL